MGDAFALGTKGWRSLSLELKTKQDFFDENTMEIVLMPHTVDRVVNAGFVVVTERLNKTFYGQGKHSYMALPVGDDIKDIWIMGDGIQHLRLDIDGETLYDMDQAQYEAYLIEKGRNVAALNGNWFLDIHAERDPRSIAALDRKGERQRDARIKLTVTTTQEVTPVEFLLTNADIYSKIR